LDLAVDFGWFTVIAYPLLKTLKWIHTYLMNYGIAIILLTILVKLLTFPLTYKSMKSMKEMQRIQPQMQKLREKYKDDKERLNKEMLQLMRTNGYNPMSGCLPIFIQMPVFVALYNVLFGAIDLYKEPFFGWILDFLSKDFFSETKLTIFCISSLSFGQITSLGHTSKSEASREYFLRVSLSSKTSPFTSFFNSLFISA
jgi:YidC/Oxa1 family membrane protein insertase